MKGYRRLGISITRNIWIGMAFAKYDGYIDLYFQIGSRTLNAMIGWWRKR